MILTLNKFTLQYYLFIITSILVPSPRIYSSSMYLNHMGYVEYSGQLLTILLKGFFSLLKSAEDKYSPDDYYQFWDWFSQSSRMNLSYPIFMKTFHLYESGK